MVVITAIVVALAFGASTPPSPPPSPAPTSSTPTTEVPVGSTPAEVDYVEADTDLAPGRLYVHLDEVTPAQQEAIDVAFAAQLLAEEAYVNPNADGLEERVPELFVPDGERWNEFESNVVYLRENGLRTRIDPQEPWELHVFAIEFHDDPWPQARLLICYLDTATLYEPNGAPDGEDVIVFENRSATVGWLTLAKQNGRQRSYWFEPAEEATEGADATCPSELN